MPLLVTDALQNAGFEDTDADGAPAVWQKYGGTLESTSSPVRSGQHAARFSSDSDSTKWAYETVLVDPGSTYAFGAWVLDDDGAVQTASLRISWYASGDGGGSALGSADSTDELTEPSADYRWLTTGGVTAPPEAHSAHVRVLLAPRSGAHATIYIDDASFGPAPPDPTPVDEPQPVGGTSTRAQSSTPARAVLGTTKKPARGQSSPAATVSSGASRVVINEVLYDAIGSAPDADGEWVELYNAGDSEVDLAGWRLSDDASIEVLESTTLTAGGFVVLTASNSFVGPTPKPTTATPHPRIGNSLGNNGDHLLLTDPAGNIVDAVSWGNDTYAFDPSVPDVPAGHSIERRQPGLDTDSAADWVDNDSPSPGSATDSSAGKPVREIGNAIQVLPGHASGSHAWLIWPIVAFAAAAAVGATAWRIGPAALQRVRSRSS